MPLTPVLRQNGPLRGFVNHRSNVGTTGPLSNNLANNLVEIEKVNDMWRKRIRTTQEALKAMMQRHSLLNNDIVQRNASLQKEMMHQQAQIELLRNESIQQRVLIKVLKSEKEEAERLLEKAKEENARLQERLDNLEELQLLATKKAPPKKPSDNRQQDPLMAGHAGLTRARTRKVNIPPSRMPGTVKEREEQEHPTVSCMRPRTYNPKPPKMQPVGQVEREDAESDAESCSSNNIHSKPTRVQTHNPTSRRPHSHTDNSVGRPGNPSASFAPETVDEVKEASEPPKRALRARTLMSYKEPPLHTKLRRPE